MIPILEARRMRAADAATIRRGTPSDALMESAAAQLCGELERSYPHWTRVAVVCGPGNNGGDGLATARILAQHGIAIDLFTLGDPAAYRGDPAVNLARAAAFGLAPRALGSRGGFDALRRSLAQADGVVDALFGTGLGRRLDGGARRAVDAINGAGRPVVSADVPSGLFADGGAITGPAVRAAVTVAFGAPKPCHVIGPASALCGRVVVADIGIARATLEQYARRLWLAETSDARSLLPARPLESHKADFGRLAIVAGSRGKAGAAVLAARGALRAGAGLVTVFCAESLEDLVVAALPEAMTFGLPQAGGGLAARGSRILVDALAGFDAVVIGPGLGSSGETVAFLETFLGSTRLPVLADADALNAFSGRPGFFAVRRGPTVLTPHPGEAARLLSTTAAKIQADRLGSARALAKKARAVVILKGAHSLVAEPSGGIAVNPTGSPLLAAAGSGDVLSGVVGALLAGGLGPREAAVAGAWLHGAAADSLVPLYGDAGLLAHEVADAVPRARAGLRSRQ